MILSKPLWLALLGVEFGLAPPLFAQNYPAKPIRLVIPFSPGGATDVPGRILAHKMSEVLGQQMVVDNRPGAGSTIGTDLVAKSPADGYTLLLTATPFVIGAGLYAKLPYDPLKDFAPIMQIGSAPNVLVVHPSLPAKSVKELIAVAEAGVPGYDATLWLGLAAPEGTPRAIIDRLNAEITRALQSPDITSGFRNVGTDVVASTPEAFGALIRSEYGKWVRVVKESGAQVN